MLKNKKGDLSVNIMVLVVIVLIVMVLMIFVFTGKVRFFSKAISSCSSIGICSENGNCEDPDYPVQVMVEDINCKYSKKGGPPLSDESKELRVCCQKVG